MINKLSLIVLIKFSFLSPLIMAMDVEVVHPMSLEQAKNIWTREIQQIQQEDYAEYKDDILPLPDIIAKYGGLSTNIPSKDKISVIKASNNFALFLDIAKIILYDLKRKFNGVSEIETQNNLTSTEQYKALLLLTEGAKNILTKLNVKVLSSVNGLTVYDRNHEARSLAFMERQGQILPFIFFNDKGFHANPMEFYLGYNYQLMPLSLNGDVVTDSGFFLRKHGQGFRVGLYNGKFNDRPFSVSLTSVLLNDNFESFCEEYAAIRSKEANQAFIPLYSSEREKLGFLAEFNGWLSENYEQMALPPVAMRTIEPEALTPLIAGASDVSLPETTSNAVAVGDAADTFFLKREQYIAEEKEKLATEWMSSQPKKAKNSKKPKTKQNGQKKPKMADKADTQAKVQKELLKKLGQRLTQK